MVVPLKICNVAGAVLNKADGAGTVTEIVNCTPDASDTTTLAEPPDPPDTAPIVRRFDPVGIDAFTSPGLLLVAV